MLVVPLTSIKQQLLKDCSKIGISVLDGDQVSDIFMQTISKSSMLRSGQQT